MRKLLLLTAVSGFALIAAACSGTTPTAAPAATVAPATSAPVVEATATSAPTAETVSEATTAPEPTATTVEQATEAPADVATAETPAGDTSTAAAVVAVANTRLNLNTVTADELMSTIPGFSSRMVREFQEYRPYVSIQQFRREIGKYVDDATVAGYEQYVYVPVDVNQADAETLKQLPGVDDAIASQLIAGRPYNSSDAFLTQLAQLIPANDLAAAAGYLQAQ